MKTKKLNKKLVLNKKTISNLDMKRMKSVNGGIGTMVNCTGFELCSLYPILCITGPCPAETVEDTCFCSGHATCGEHTCNPPFTNC